MLYNDYGNVNFGEIELCLMYIKDNIQCKKYNQKEYLSIFKALSLLSHELRNPRLMYRSEARLYYPKMNELIFEISDLLQEKMDKENQSSNDQLTYKK